MKIPVIAATVTTDDMPMRSLTERPVVIILLGSPFTDQNVERLGLHKLAMYFHIYVIDCARLLGRNPDAINVEQAHWPYYVKVKTAEQLRLALLTSGAKWAIDNIGIDVDTAWIGSLVKGHGIGIVSVKSGRLPQPKLLRRLYAFVKRQPQNAVKEAREVRSQSAGQPEFVHKFIWLTTLWIKMASRVTYEWRRRNNFPTPDVVLLAGNDSKKTIDAKKSTFKVWIGSEDYYKYCSVAKSLSDGAIVRRGKPYVLFIDVCLPYATDWKYLGIAPPITAQEYYPLLRRLFDRIEYLLDLPIVVAGHPNTRWVPDYVELIGGRELEVGHTPELVMQAELVMSHASTAASFIALSGKPSVFISSYAIARTNYGEHVRAMADSLRSRTIMLEDTDILKLEHLSRKTDAAAFRRYVASYLRSENCSESEAWEGLIDFISRHPLGPINSQIKN